MNELTNKAQLWNKCIEQGIFNAVNKSDDTDQANVNLNESFYA
jgi:hypothetical protein